MAYLADAIGDGDSDRDATEVVDEEFLISPESVKLVKLISNVKTRCWSVVDMLSRIVEQRAANGNYALKNPAFNDLTPGEYKTICMCF